MKKTCIECGEERDISEFRKQKQTRDGFANQCRLCLNAHQRDKRKRQHNVLTLRYEKTYKGFLVRLYRNMQSRVKGIQKAKFHLYEGKYLLDKEEFYRWALDSPCFYKLFKTWEESGYKQTLTPSVDRVDSNKGYSIDNMEWVTHSENSRRGSVNRNFKNRYNE